MTQVLAIHRIHRNPSRRMKATGHHDADGNLVLVSDTEIVPAGDRFEVDDETELAFLLQVGAARLLSDDEITLEKMSRGE